MKQILLILGSLRLTLIIMLALAATALLSHDNPDIPVLWVALPLTLLGINLLTAIVSNPRFRRQPGLILFHLGLLAVIILAALGLMTSLDAHLEITEGQAFDPADVEITNQGPWHRYRLHEIRFTQGKVKIDYVSALRRSETRSQIWLVNEQGGSWTRTIGDGVTLKSKGYRFITTGNKGYSIILTWLNEEDSPSVGAINMPSFPMFEWKQENKWITPSGQALTLSLLDNLDSNKDVDAAWVLDSEYVQANLLIIENDREHVLNEGDTIKLKNGVLRFEGVRMWIGYSIDSNPLLFWQFLAALFAVVGLGHHFWQKFSRPSASVHNSNAVFKIDYDHPVHS